MLDAPGERRATLTVLAVLMTAAIAIAQCGTQSLPAGVSALNGSVHALAAWDPDGAGPAPSIVVAGGAFTLSGTTSVNHIAIYDEGSDAWYPLGTGCDNTVRALLALGNGDLIAAGDFTLAGGIATNHIARWSGGSWTALGSGMDAPVLALTATLQGDIIAGGQFTTAGGAPADRIAEWNGAFWSQLGPGTGGTVLALATMTNGSVIVGGTFAVNTPSGYAANIARWDGTTLAKIFDGLGGPVRVLLALPNDEFVAGGVFSTTGLYAISNPVLFSGTWRFLYTSTLPYSPFATVSALAVLPNGDIVGGGTTAPSGSICLVRWPGSSSSSWGGSLWSTGLGGSTSAAMTLNALAARRDGALMAGGQFTVVGSPGTWQAARLETTCPAVTASHGSGCSGSAGPLLLSAVTTPWTGARFVACATTFAPGGFAFRILGWGAQSVPLAQLHPAGGPGCDLLVTHDASSLLFAVGGTVTWQLDIPNRAVFAGTTLHSQIVQAELDPAANLTLLSSSNRLTLSVGTY